MTNGHRLALLIFHFVWFQLLYGATVFCQDNDSRLKQPEQAVQRKTVTIQVFDAEGDAIDGVKLDARYMLCDRGGTGWIDPEPEKVKNLISDSDGKIVLTYPAQRSGRDLVLIDVELAHPDFISDTVRIDTGETSVSFRLERGFRVALNAIDAQTGKPILEGLAVPLIHDTWSMSTSGQLISPLLTPRSSGETAQNHSKSGHNRFRVVQIVDGEAKKFSELIEVDDHPGSRVRLKDVKMYDAVRVFGRIDDTIPRPITNGKIGACVAWLPTNLDEHLPDAFCWNVVRKIDQDGRFDLGGFPRNAKVQIIAECDGWFSKSATKAEIKTTFANEVTDRFPESQLFPQLVQIGDQGVQEVALPMVAANSLKITVVDDQDKPIKGAKVHFNRTGIKFIGVVWWVSPSPAEQLLTAHDGRLMPSGKPEELTFSSGYSVQNESRNDGSVEIRNLPGGHAHLQVWHPEFVGFGFEKNDPQSRILLLNGEAKEVKVRLSKK